MSLSDEVKRLVSRFSKDPQGAWRLIAVGAGKECGGGKCCRVIELVYEQRGTGELRKERHELPVGQVELWGEIRRVLWRCRDLREPEVQQKEESEPDNGN